MQEALYVAGNPHCLTKVSDPYSSIVWIRPALFDRSKTVPYVPTEYIGLRLGEAIQQISHNAQRTFWEVTSSDPKSRALAEWLFETLLHDHLSNIGLEIQVIDQLLVQRALYGSDNIIRRSQELSTAMDSNRDFYWIPNNPNFSGIHSCLCNGNALYLFQCAVSTTQTTAKVGIETIKQLALITNIKRKKCFMVYVAPDEYTRDFVQREAHVLQVKEKWHDIFPLTICGCFVDFPDHAPQRKLVNYAVSRAGREYRFSITSLMIA